MEDCSDYCWAPPARYFLPRGLLPPPGYVRETGQSQCELGLADLPIIALSAGVLEEERRQTRESGMNVFHPKPKSIDLPELTRQIRQLCKAREMAPDPIHSITIL